MSEKNERKTSVILLGPEKNENRAARILYWGNQRFFFFFARALPTVHKTARPPETGANSMIDCGGV